MKKESKIDQTETLDQEMLELLGSAPKILPQTSARQAQLRKRIMVRIEEEQVDPAYLTVYDNDGVWIEIAPLVKKKILRTNPETGEESFLLRMQPGAALEQHKHDADELCMVLDGDVSFDDLQLGAGDFHFALKGSSHGVASTVNGAILFLQTAFAPTHAFA